MSATPLLDQLFRDADAEAARRLAAARAEATRLEAEGDATLAAERHDALHARARSLGVVLESERAERHRQRHLELLAARRRLVDRALGVAIPRALGLVHRADAMSALQRMLRKALAYLSEDGGTVRCHPLLLPALSGMEPPVNATLVADDGLPYGFVAESHDGRVRVDATLETLVAREREMLSIALVKQHAAGGR